MSAAQLPIEIPPCGCGSPGAALPATCYCSLEDLLKVIRRPYSLAVMNAIFQRQPARYREVAAQLPQASSSTLSETLAALEAAYLVTRQAAEAVPTATYSLTAAGEKLLNRLRRLLDEVQQ